MLARLARELPVDDEWCYEPKWDGFRCLAFCTDNEVDLRSRNQRPLARYFPEIAQAVRQPLPACGVFDGELVVRRDDHSDFAALMARLHPAASRVELLARSTPATFIVFDLLAAGDEVLVELPFQERR